MMGEEDSLEGVSLSDARELSKAIVDYAGAESEGSKEALVFLARVLEAAELKLQSSRTVAAQITKYTEETVQRYRERAPILEDISTVDKEITELEQLVRQLDEYTVRLEQACRTYS